MNEKRYEERKVRVEEKESERRNRKGGKENER